jgi:hypothetical protein
MIQLRGGKAMNPVKQTKKDNDQNVKMQRKEGKVR